MTQPEWAWKYDQALMHARHPRKQESLQKALAELAD